MLGLTVRFTCKDQASAGGYRITMVSTWCAAGPTPLRAVMVIRKVWPRARREALPVRVAVPSRRGRKVIPRGSLPDLASRAAGSRGSRS